MMASSSVSKLRQRKWLFYQMSGWCFKFMKICHSQMPSSSPNRRIECLRTLLYLSVARKYKFTMGCESLIQKQKIQGLEPIYRIFLQHELHLMFAISRNLSLAIAIYHLNNIKSEHNNRI